jgi:hypothetical protein
MSDKGTEPPAEQKNPWLWTLGIGLFMYLGAAFLFFYFSHLEQTGGTASMHAALALLYRLGGKWLVVGVLGAGGTLMVAVGIADLLKARK